MTWDYDTDGVPRMTEYGREQMDAYRTGKADPENYFVSSVPIHLSLSQLLVLNVSAAVLMMLIISLSTRFISRISPDRTMRVE